MERLTNYLRATIAEMKQVSWPTKKTAFLYTLLVIGISSLVSLIVAGFDYMFTSALNLFIS